MAKNGFWFTIGSKRCFWGSHLPENLSKGLKTRFEKSNGGGEAERTEVSGVGNCFPRGVSTQRNHHPKKGPIHRPPANRFINSPLFLWIWPFSVGKNQGWRNGRFGKRSFCPLPKTGGFDVNWQKFWYCILPTKKGVLLLGPRKSTKMTKLAGVTPAKWPFAKSTVLTTLNFYYLGIIS